jgi:uncharacterized membrane protein YfcA
MEISLFTIAASSAVVFLAFLVRSLTGFGSALISVPLLALLFDLKFVVPLESVLEIGFTLLLVRKVYGRIRMETLLPMIAGASLGTIIGAQFLISLADFLLKKALGVFILLFALYYCAGVRKEGRDSFSNAWGFPAGAAGGILGGVFGTSGPPFVAYLAYRLKEKDVLRASLIGMFAVDYGWRTAVFAFSGLLTGELLSFFLYLTPALIFGTILGHMIHLRVTEGQFKKIVAGILLTSGVLLLW